MKIFLLQNTCERNEECPTLILRYVREKGVSQTPLRL